MAALSKENRENLSRMFAYVAERERNYKRSRDAGRDREAMEELFLAVTSLRSISMMMLGQIDKKAADAISKEHDL
jgi:hypothetical protein